MLLSFFTQRVCLLDIRDEFPSFSGLGLDSDSHPCPDMLDQEKFDPIPESKEDLLNEPLFFRSFAIGLMVFGLSGALLYAFKVNPVFLQSCWPL